MSTNQFSSIDKTIIASMLASLIKQAGNMYMLPAIPAPLLMYSTNANYLFNVPNKHLVLIDSSKLIKLNFIDLNNTLKDIATKYVAKYI